MEWQEGKVLSGSQQYRSMVSSPGSPLASYTSKASSRMQSPVSSTGSLSSTSPERGLFDPFESCLGHTISNSPDPRLQKTMFGRKLLESMERNLNLGCDLDNEPVRLIGRPCGSPPVKEELPIFPQTSAFVVTLHCEPSARHMLFRLACNEWLMSIGAELVLASREELGEKPVWTLTLKIRALNSGVDTKVREMLSLMSFEEESTFPICLDGWIDTQSGWRSKAQVCPCVLKEFGSPQMFIPRNGGPTWTLQH